MFLCFIIFVQVNFSEPLSMLQRITEDFEYSNILDVAAQCKDPLEQMAYVAAFSISSYSTTVNRTSKPFNPLLGETYECDRMSDLGWKAFNEQVNIMLINSLRKKCLNKKIYISFRFHTILQFQHNIVLVKNGSAGKNFLCPQNFVVNICKQFLMV